MTDADRLDALRIELQQLRAEIALNLPRSHTDLRLVRREHEVARRIDLLTRKIRDETGG
ncbi:hypothetical protein [Sphingomonas alba]|uniref:50S ribosomal protein L29 n=1 Tax=Sphingomonas alba TaxID=2908208 RepID=A0ABT0RNL3_9SPHN|nr:hypothetical protein [Sphingomonas alba]MCL6684105.1 hypothetical protein [Sphingomonas alba]